MSIFHFKKSLVALSLIIVIGLGSIAGIAKADDSKPGDTLFGLDTLLEEIKLFITRNPETKLQIKIAIAEERLQELSDLTDELKIASDSDTDDQSDNTTTTSTDSGTSSTATSTPNNTADSNSLAEAITQALTEVDGAVARLKNDALKLKVRSNSGSRISTEQKTAFLEQVNLIISREDILIKKLELKIKKNKLELKIKFVKINNNNTDNDEGDDNDDDGIVDEFEGVIDKVNISENTVTLTTGLTIQLNNNTVIDPLGDLFTLSTVSNAHNDGKKVRAEGRINSNNIVTSIKFEVDGDDDNDEGDNNDGIVDEFEGVISDVNLDTASFTLANTIIILTNTTTIDTLGDLLSLSAVSTALDDGTTVRAEGKIDADNNAITVKFETDSTTTTNSQNDNNNSDSDSNSSSDLNDISKVGEKEKTEGPIEFINGSNITVNGLVFKVNSSTETNLDDDKSLDELSVGDIIEIEGEYISNNELLAKKIKN